MASAVDSNRRLKPRRRAEKESDVQLFLPWYGGQRREATGVLVDAAPGGIGVRLAHPLALGTLASIDAKVHLGDASFRITGQSEVANCRVAGADEYRIGLRFVDVSWERLKTPDDNNAPEEASSSDVEVPNEEPPALDADASEEPSSDAEDSKKEPPPPEADASEEPSSDAEDSKKEPSPPPEAA